MMETAPLKEAVILETSVKNKLLLTVSPSDPPPSPSQDGLGVH